jgi:hypothetical protein
LSKLEIEYTTDWWLWPYYLTKWGEFFDIDATSDELEVIEAESISRQVKTGYIMILIKKNM